jgi:hypothetical protein
MVPKMQQVEAAGIVESIRKVGERLDVLKEKDTKIIQQLRDNKTILQDTFGDAFDIKA